MSGVYSDARCLYRNAFILFIISDPKYEGKWNYIERTCVEKIIQFK